MALIICILGWCLQFPCVKLIEGLGFCGLVAELSPCHVIPTWLESWLIQAFHLFFPFCTCFFFPFVFSPLLPVDNCLPPPLPPHALLGSAGQLLLVTNVMTTLIICSYNKKVRKLSPFLIWKSWCYHLLIFTTFLWPCGDIPFFICNLASRRRLDYQPSTFHQCPLKIEIWRINVVSHFLANVKIKWPFSKTYQP